MRLSRARPPPGEYIGCLFDIAGERMSASRTIGARFIGGGTLQILLFGKLGEAVGRVLSHPDSDGLTVAALRQSLACAHPGAASELLSPRVRVCVNDTMVEEDHCLRPGDEVALLPPVSGG